jgi:chromatin structure-remodeling complex subunit RSC4
MSKREATMFAAQGIDVDAPRAKRLKTGATTGQSSANAPTTGDIAAANEERSGSGENEKPSEASEQVKEKGLKLWQTIKDARDKECVTSLALSIAVVW